MITRIIIIIIRRIQFLFINMPSQQPNDQIMMMMIIIIIIIIINAKTGLLMPNS